MSTPLPLGPAACALKWCSKPFVRTRKNSRQRYCTKAHGGSARKQAKKTRSGSRSPRFVLEMLQETPVGECIFGCGNETNRFLCKDKECVNLYKSLWNAEKRAKRREAAP